MRVTCPQYPTRFKTFPPSVFLLGLLSLSCVLARTPTQAAPGGAATGSGAGKSKGHDKVARPKLKPQEASASGQTWAMIAASQPAVKQALDASDLNAARKLVNRTVSFQGTVTKVYSPSSNSITILDFAPNFHNALAAVVKPAAYSKFPALKDLKGRHVLISGKLILFHNQPEIEMTSPSQIKIIQ